MKKYSCRLRCHNPKSHILSNIRHQTLKPLSKYRLISIKTIPPYVNLRHLVNTFHLLHPVSFYNLIMVDDSYTLLTPERTIKPKRTLTRFENAIHNSHRKATVSSCILMGRSVSAMENQTIFYFSFSGNVKPLRANHARHKRFVIIPT